MIRYYIIQSLLQQTKMSDGVQVSYRHTVQKTAIESIIFVSFSHCSASLAVEFLWVASPELRKTWREFVNPIPYSL